MPDSTGTKQQDENTVNETASTAADKNLQDQKPATDGIAQEGEKAPKETPLTGADKKLQEEKPDPKESFEKKKGYAQIITSISAVVISLTSLFSTMFIYNKTAERQLEMQAFTYWQNYLQLAVKYPAMANGDDSRYYDLHKNNAAERVEYEWFVANALGAAEIVYDLQKDDGAWKNTLKETIRLHGQYIISKGFDSTHYSSDFDKLVRETVTQ